MRASEALKKLCPFSGGAGFYPCRVERCMAWQTTAWAAKEIAPNGLDLILAIEGYCKLIEKREEVSGE